MVPADVTPWLEAKEFITHTRSDASNSRPKLFNRIHYVRDNLLGNAVTLDPDTALVERSANAEAPADEPQAQGSLW
ncbi:MAG TPA: hypothetical protein DCY18_05640 [Thauera sp.]|nr:hypothetical protein [Thauera sp.]